MKVTSVLALIVMLQEYWQECIGVCYFPSEFQGEYKMQSALSSHTGVQYSTLNITGTSIPIWGNCHQRRGNNFILVIDYGENKCIRCLHLKMRSKNIMQVFTTNQETISKCYISEESAVANCPSPEFLQNSTIAEILLFKTKDVDGAHIKKEYCPLDGKFSVRYKINDQKNALECPGEDSSLDSCPSGSTLNFRFRKCNFQSYDTTFECLGHWEGSQGENYLALVDNRQSKNQSTQYRCALYTRDPASGVVNMAFGRDSSCITDVHNTTQGYESFILIPQIENNWPPEVLYSQCNFPGWIEGTWEHVTVQDNTFTYKDRSSFKTYTIKCIGVFDDGDKYLVFSRTQCGEEQYNCMRIQRRSDNIMEFQLGKSFSTEKDVYGLCDQANFEEGHWITQGRLERERESSCPISGEYTGLIPDTTDLCAKLWSDCRAPELMYYQVSDCMTYEIYEEREYRCLGHWRENNLLYTYTQRKDVGPGTFECFVGSMLMNKETIYIKEAGEHCQRDIDPGRHGMKLNKQGLYSCIDYISTPKYISTTKPPSTTVSVKTTRKPWIDIQYQDPGTNNIDNTLGNVGRTRYSNFVFVLSVIFLVAAF